MNEQIESQAISTIKRRICAIAFAHAMLDLPLSTKGNAIRLALRRADRFRYLPAFIVVGALTRRNSGQAAYVAVIIRALLSLDSR